MDTPHTPQSSPLRTQPMTWLRSGSSQPSLTIAAPHCSHAAQSDCRFWHFLQVLCKQLLHETKALPLVLLQVVQSALAEDAGELGDVTTLST